MTDYSNEAFKIMLQTDLKGVVARTQKQDGSKTMFTFDIEFFDWAKSRTYYATVFQYFDRSIDVAVSNRVKVQFGHATRTLAAGQRADIQERAIEIYCDVFGLVLNAARTLGARAGYRYVSLKNFHNEAAGSLGVQSATASNFAAAMCLKYNEPMNGSAWHDYAAKARMQIRYGYTAPYASYVPKEPVAAVEPVETTRPHFANMAEAIDCIGRDSTFEGLADGSILIADLSSLETPMTIKERDERAEAFADVEHIEVSFATLENWASPATEIGAVLRRVATDFETNGIPAAAIYSDCGKFIGEVKISKESDDG
jgi:hypothetical protein